jgi:hypothetical protein
MIQSSLGIININLYKTVLASLIKGLRVVLTCVAYRAWEEDLSVNRPKLSQSRQSTSVLSLCVLTCNLAL